MSRSIACTLSLALGCSVHTDGLMRPIDGGRHDAELRDTGTDGSDGRSDDAGGGDAGAADAGFDAGPTGELRTLRWELPCGRMHSSADWLCETAYRADDTATMDGAPGALYDVTIHVRGVVEMKTIYEGTPERPFHVGGTARTDDWTEAGLTVSDPAARYWLNSGTSGSDACAGLGYERTIQIRQGATVAVWGATSNVWSNRNFDDGGEPIVVPGVRPDPMPFDGQFIQVDAVAIREASP